MTNRITRSQPSSTGSLPREARVLILADDPRAAAACGLLRRLGAHARATCDGREAVRLLASARWQAIVVDLDAEQIDAMAVVAAIRNCARTADATVVALARSLTDERLRRALEGGCDRVLGGRVDADRLAAEIDRAVASRPSRLPRAA